MKHDVCVVIPNWDGADMIGDTITSLQHQVLPCDIIVVDNGSKDGSLELLRPMAQKGDIILIEHTKNMGFTGGVNAGFRYAMDHGYTAVASLNNDAKADKNWLKYLYERLMTEPKAGTVTGKILSLDGSHMDSTGDILTNWGLPYPRGRGEPTSNNYDKLTRIFGASGGATLFKCSLLREVGVYDQDFFAYYEDTDLSLRTRLAGWEIYFEPKAFVFHAIGATGERVRGFTTKQTMKNMPWVLIKDVPGPLLWPMIPRFLLAYVMFFGRAMVDGRGLWALRGLGICLWLLPKKIGERRHIQRTRVVTVKDIASLLTYDLPPNATKLRKLRSAWWKLTGKGTTTS